MTVENICGKKLKFKKTFKNNGSDFSGFQDAIEFLKENNYSTGSMQRNMPIGLKKGDYDISKWRNLNGEDILNLDGCITFPDGSPRNSDAIIWLSVSLVS